MYTLLIADDEPLECDAIELLVTRANLPLRVIKARNGKQAVELAEHYSPHLAFLDIRMPGMDGLEAAKQIRGIKPDCHIVFLTAWSTFEFAQQAIRLGASEYLVKPVQRKEVYDLLDRLISDLDQKKEDKLQQTQEIREVLNLFSREFFAALKFGRINEEAMRSYFSMQGITMEEGVALVIGGLTEEQIPPFFQQGRTWGKLQISYFPSIDRITVLLFTVQNVKVVEQIVGSVDDYDLVVGSGIPFTSFAQIPQSIATASIAYSYAYRHHTRLQRYSEVLRMPKDIQKTSELNMQIISDTLAGKVEAARTAAHQLIDTINTTNETEEAGIDEFHQLLTVFTYELHKEVPLLRHAPIPKSSVMEQEIYLMDMIDTACQAIKLDRRDRYDRPFKYVKQYLDEHMDSILSVEDMAKLVGINSKYFSQLCKTYLGSTFVEYLTKIRMEKAHQLLGEGIYTVREVAQQTGFTDGNYFSRVFRQYYGYSPSSLKDAVSEDSNGH
ncbi:MAG: response regulator [Sphaerochaeta sp.]|jgi:two-component system response regulator YesN|uniref:response regulator n=1 Tax=Sphaerochaeta sp. TaxID=1972642 RepID=UPI002FCB7421